MFSADEVINPNGARGVEYFDYDFRGNVIDNQPSIEEFIHRPRLKPSPLLSPWALSALCTFARYIEISLHSTI
jgi:hypothetical protein